MSKEDYLWTERYRPTTIEDCILPVRIKTMMKEYISGYKIPNLILTGNPGCGKGSLVNAIIEETKADSIFINCSSDANLDMVRNTITKFASTISLFDNDHKKIIVLDELDGVTSPAFQPALRSFTETFSTNALFIMTANNQNKIIPALKSRCVEIDYKKEITRAETPAMMKQFMARTKYILDNEGVKYNSKVLATLIKNSFPDFRKTINNLQQYSISGEIDTGILIDAKEDIDVLVGYVKAKEFTKMREFVEGMNDADIYTSLFNKFVVLLSNNSIPQMVITIGEYQYKASFVTNPNINLLACLTEIMLESEWK